MRAYEAGPHDVDDIVRLVNGAYRGAEAQRGWTTEAGLVDGQRTDPRMITSDLNTGHILITRDVEGGELTGCVYLETYKPNQWYLGMLTIRPTLQARGLGRTVLAAAENFAAARGGRRIELQVLHVRTSLIEWYERRGYVATGERRPFPVGQTQFGLPRRDDFEFVRLGKALPLP